jgi:hypothetical protein
VEEPTITKSKKAWQVGSSTKSVFTVNLLLLTLWSTLTFERKCAIKKTGTLAQPQLALSS